MLDIQGNIANAAVLTTHLRMRPFIAKAAGENKSQWIWAASRRWQWENPDRRLMGPVEGDALLCH